VRIPASKSAAAVQKVDLGNYKVPSIVRVPCSMRLLFYYRLATTCRDVSRSSLPRREKKPGTFMMVLLQALI